MKAYTRQFNRKIPPTSQHRGSSTHVAFASHPAAHPDHRPEAIAQRRWPAAIGQSPRVVAQAERRGLIDHSPRQAAQRLRMKGLFGQFHPAGYSEQPLQRMTYVMSQADGAFSSVEDRATHRAYATDAGKTPILDTAADVAEQALTGNLAENRELHIYAHGNQAAVGRFSPAELKTHLTDDCKINPLKTGPGATGNPETSAVVLHSCLSGVKHPSKNIASPAEQLSKALTAHYANTKVAVAGFHSITSTVGTNTVSPGKQFHDDIQRWEGVMADIRQHGNPSENKQAEALYYAAPKNSYVVFEDNNARRKARRKAKKQAYSFDEGGVTTMPLGATAKQDAVALKELHEKIMKRRK